MSTFLLILVWVIGILSIWKCFVEVMFLIKWFLINGVEYVMVINVERYADGVWKQVSDKIQEKGGLVVSDIKTSSGIYRIVSIKEVEDSICFKIDFINTEIGKEFKTKFLRSSMIESKILAEGTLEGGIITDMDLCSLIFSFNREDFD